ncbi:hypothetical protein IWW45_004885 [Coemansia sp. RSA 485]|nr:hypothetical protein IWW45_004885 [Coemansia sp. RSA 485]
MRTSETTTARLVLVSAFVLLSSGVCNANGLHARQAVGVTTPTPGQPGAGLLSSTDPVGVPATTPTTPAVVTTPTALAPAVDEKTTDTDTDVGGGAVSSTKTTTSRTTAPQQPDDARPATTPTRPSSSSSSSPSSASTKGAVPATKSSSSTKALADEPTTSSSSITQANNVVGAQGGGGGDVATPGNTPAPANVMTATKGTGGILEYGECIDFENQCNGMCSYGIYSMNCIDGGICLCFKDDPDNTDTDTGADEDTADETDDDEDGSGNNKTRVSSHADRQVSSWSLAAASIPALAALLVSSAFF